MTSENEYTIIIDININIRKKNDCCHCYGCRTNDPEEHYILTSNKSFNTKYGYCECTQNCHCYGCKMGDIQEHYILYNTN